MNRTEDREKDATGVNVTVNGNEAPGGKDAPVSSYTKKQRALALSAAVLLLLLFVGTLAAGIIGGEKALPFLQLFIFLDIAVPVMLFAYIKITRLLRDRRDREG